MAREAAIQSDLRTTKQRLFCQVLPATPCAACARLCWPVLLSRLSGLDLRLGAELLHACEAACCCAASVMVRLCQGCLPCHHDFERHYACSCLEAFNSCLSLPVTVQTCAKQYKTAGELEVHLSSYDHHHKKVIALLHCQPGLGIADDAAHAAMSLHLAAGPALRLLAEHQSLAAWLHTAGVHQHLVKMPKLWLVTPYLLVAS